MPKLLAPIDLASPQEQAKRIKDIGKVYRETVRKVSSDVPFALDFPGNPLGLGLSILPALTLGAREVGMAAKGGRVLEKNLGRIRNAISSAWGLGKKGLPKFRSTEEALVFGADWAGDQRIANLLRSALGQVDEEFAILAKGGRQTFQKRMESAVEGQFLREALETVEGKTAPHWLESLGYKGYAQTPTPSVSLEKETKALFKEAQEDLRQIQMSAFGQ